MAARWYRPFRRARRAARGQGRDHCTGRPSDLERARQHDRLAAYVRSPPLRLAPGRSWRPRRRGGAREGALMRRPLATLLVAAIAATTTAALLALPGSAAPRKAP